MKFSTAIFTVMALSAVMVLSQAAPTPEVEQVEQVERVHSQPYRCMDGCWKVSGGCQCS